MTAVRRVGRASLFLLISSFLLLAPAPDTRAEDKPVDTNFACYQCHSKTEITPWIAETWSKSAHARAGVKCYDCHGNHDAGFESAEFTPLPGPEVCRKCHPINVKDTMAGAHAATTKCTSCHPRHSFSLNVARNPRICETCHTGDKHVDGYRNSKMGVVYATEGPGSAATCQTCHMPGGVHNVNKTIDNKDEMLKVCNNCHSASFAGTVLKSGKFSTHW